MYAVCILSGPWTTINFDDSARVNPPTVVTPRSRVKSDEPRKVTVVEGCAGAATGTYILSLGWTSICGRRAPTRFPLQGITKECALHAFSVIWFWFTIDSACICRPLIRCHLTKQGFGLHCLRCLTVMVKWWLMFIGIAITQLQQTNNQQNKLQ